MVLGLPPGSRLVASPSGLVWGIPTRDEGLPPANSPSGGYPGHTAAARTDSLFLRLPGQQYDRVPIVLCQRRAVSFLEQSRVSLDRIRILNHSNTKVS